MSSPYWSTDNRFKEITSMNVLIGIKMMDVSKFEIRELDNGEIVWVKPARRKTDTETLFNEKGKMCKGCGDFVRFNDYNKDIKCIGGKTNKCKKCQQQYYVENKKHINNRCKQYYIENKESILEKNKQYDRIDYNKRYYEEHKDKAMNRSKEHYKCNQSECNQYAKQRRNKKALYDEFKVPLGYICKSDENGFLLISCYKCGKMHHPTNQQLDTLIRAQSGVENTGSCNVYCSDHCKETCNVFNKPASTYTKRHLLNLPMTPPRNTNRPYVSQKFIKQVLETDEYACQKCGNNHIRLHVHHVIGATRHPEFANDLDNCITLCEDCHNEVHNQIGCSTWDYRLDENK